MATRPSSAISEHDVAVLREPVKWAAGTTGAVVRVYDDTLLVEITGTGGDTVDTIQVRVSGLHIKQP